MTIPRQLSLLMSKASMVSGVVLCLHTHTHTHTTCVVHTCLARSSARAKAVSDTWPVARRWSTFCRSMMSLSDMGLALSSTCVCTVLANSERERDSERERMCERERGGEREGEQRSDRKRVCWREIAREREFERDGESYKEKEKERERHERKRERESERSE